MRSRSIKASLAGIVLLVAVSACSVFTKQVALATIETALAVCIAENPGADEKELQQACHFANDLLPVVRLLLAAQARGAKKGHSHDAGVSDASTDSGLDAGIHDAAQGQ